ncbi:hypothetical protein FQZ97_984150 [compost metagenome]
MLRSVATIFTFAALFISGIVTVPAPAFSQHQLAAVGARINNGHRIHCNQGTRLLRARGFHNVRALDCRGSHFLYRGNRVGRTYDITVRARDGRITNMRLVRWRR